MTAGLVALELLDQIERVAAQRERWRIYARQGVLEDFVARANIAMSSIAIDAAKRALAEEDGVAAFDALAKLRRWPDD